MWEVRGEQQHFVYSKVMCWAALDYAAYIAAATGHRQMYRRWSLAADSIKTEILDAGWSANKKAFRQRYGHDALDASNLAIPFMSMIPRDHPRIRQNLDAIERELADGPMVWRYLPEETDDGLGGQPEGSFTLLSFWLIGNLIYTGQHDRAFDYLHEVITKQGNHLGLFCRDVRQAGQSPTGQLPASLFAHRADSLRPEPLRVHRWHPHPPHLNTLGAVRCPRCRVSCLQLFWPAQTSCQRHVI